MKDLKSKTYNDIKITSPVGEHVTIQALQSHLNDNLSWLDLACGLAYKNKKKDGIVPEIYIGNDEYLEVLPDNRMSFCFFVMDDNIEYDEDLQKHKADASIIFFVRLNDAFSVSHRATAEAKNSVYNLLKNYKNNVEYLGMTEGIDNVYEGFDFEGKFENMEPLYCFAANIRIEFNYC